MVQPQIDTTNMTTLRASLCVILMVVIGFLYKSNQQLTKENKEDLKLFDVENKNLITNILGLD